MRAFRIVLGSMVAAALLFSGSARAVKWFNDPKNPKCTPMPECKKAPPSLTDAFMAQIDELRGKKKTTKK